MANIKYRLNHDGRYLDNSGNRVLLEDAAEFSTISEVENFVSSSLTTGEYHVITFVEKS